MAEANRGHLIYVEVFFNPLLALPFTLEPIQQHIWAVGEAIDNLLFHHVFNIVVVGILKSINCLDIFYMLEPFFERSQSFLNRTGRCFCL